MKKIFYTKEQAELLNYVKEKLKKAFSKRLVPAHGLDHIERVAGWCKEIALGEKAKSPFLCELAGWLHDVGRAFEDNPGEYSLKHHKLSYNILRDWFKTDRNFDCLTDEEKLELLYTVLYHWNNEANKYDTAWIVRDADKLDGFGEVGMARFWEIYKDDEESYDQALRNDYDCLVHVRTNTAKKIIKKEKMMEAVDKAYKKYLQSKIEPVEL